MQSREIPVGSFARRTRQSIEHLVDHRHRRLQVRVYEREPIVSMLIIDKNWALFHYYDVSTIGIETPAIEIDARNASVDTIPDVLAHLADQFERLWHDPQTHVWAWDDRA